MPGKQGKKGDKETRDNAVYPDVSLDREKG